MSPSKLKVMDSMVGRPFVLLPGSPANHVVCGETYEGVKIRALAVQSVWNDMLLMDAIEGPGAYAGGLSSFNRACLEIAERLYGVTAAEGVKIWLQLPKLRKPCEWPAKDGR